MQIAYVVLIVAYTLIDRAAFAVSGAPTTRARREWTFWAVWVPYLACFAGPIAELALGTAKPSMLGMVAGALLVAAAAGLRWVGVTTLGRAFSASVETHDGHRLVDTGIF